MKQKNAFLFLRSIFRKALKLLFYFILLSNLWVLFYRWIDPPITYLMVERYVKNDYPINKNWVDFEGISPYLVRSVIASEDQKFMSHFGFDVESIKESLIENKKGKRIRGASTISQQVAKNVFLWPDRSWIRKGLEVYFTGLIELYWTKERIIEVYLNVIEWGKGVYGVKYASRLYFKNDTAKLSRSQSALLAAVIPGPLKWNPSRPTNYINKRKFQIMYQVKLMRGGDIEKLFESN